MFEKNVLKRLKWAILGREPLTSELENALQSLYQESNPTDELLDWVDLVSNPPSLEFFNKKFKNSRGFLPNKLKKIKNGVVRNSLAELVNSP